MQERKDDSKSAGVRFPKWLADEVAELAKKEGRSFAGQVVELIKISLPKMKEEAERRRKFLYGASEKPARKINDDPPVHVRLKGAEYADVEAESVADSAADLSANQSKSG